MGKPKKEPVDVNEVLIMLDELKETKKQRECEEKDLRNVLDEALLAYESEPTPQLQEELESLRAKHIIVMISCQNLSSFIGGLIRLLAKEANKPEREEYEKY